MPTGRLGVLRSLIDKHDPEIHSVIKGDVEDLTPVEKNAILWRIDVEKAWRSLKESERGTLVVYEQLCEQTLSECKRVFEGLGIGWHIETQRFIEQLQSGRSQDQKDVRNPYFTVMRHPLSSMNSWKHQLSVEQIRSIERLIESSVPFQHVRNQGLWY
jgi:hypothetical protein